jgi:hypothetical protein
MLVRSIYVPNRASTLGEDIEAGDSIFERTHLWVTS